MDCILSLSNGAFKNEGNIEEFHKSAKTFLEKTFKGRCVSAVIHLDETTPHIHAIILPLDKKDGKWKLNARKLFSKTTLSDYQKKYYNHMKNVFPKLNPPLHGRKACHNSIKHYYNSINTSLERTIELKSKIENINTNEYYAKNHGEIELESIKKLKI